jgi:hypothetical protein
VTPAAPKQKISVLLALGIRTGMLNGVRRDGLVLFAGCESPVRRRLILSRQDGKQAVIVMQFVTQGLQVGKIN